MKKLAVLLLIAFLAACARATPEPAKTPTSTPNLTATALVTTLYDATSIQSRIYMMQTQNAYATAGYPPIKPSATPTLAYPVATAWQTYTFTDEVRIEYPADWHVEANGAYDYVDFSLYPGDPARPNFWIRLAVYDRPVEERNIADPFAMTNPSPFRILWSKAVSIENTEGWECIWGALPQDWDNWNPARASLDVIYYSEAFELDIRLTTEFDPESALLLETSSYEEVIAARFAVFEHMAQSIRIVP